MDVKKAAHLQRELLRAAVDATKVGGVIVYSTCSIAAEENEGVIDYILRKRYVKVVETGLPIEKEGLTKYEETRFDPRVKLTRRVYPHMHNMDGFYIAKLVKTKNGKRPEIGEENTVPQKGLNKKKLKKKIAKEGKFGEPKPEEATEGEDAPAGIEEPEAQAEEAPEEKVNLKKRKVELLKKIKLMKKLKSE